METDRRGGTPSPSRSAKYDTRPAMLITSARVDPVTNGPVPVANGPSSARNRSSATWVRLATVKSRRAKKLATGRRRLHRRCPTSPSGWRLSWACTTTWPR